MSSYLFLSDWFPYPLDNGTKIRNFNLIKGMVQHGHRVGLVSFYRSPVHQEDLDALRQLCQPVLTVPWKEFDPASWKARLGFLSSQPRWLVDTYSPAMQQAIANQVSQGRYDAVIVGAITMSPYYTTYRHVPALLDDLEVMSSYDAYQCASSALGRLRSSLRLRKLISYIRLLTKRFGVVTVVSRKEYEIVAGCVEDVTRVRIFPNWVAYAEYEQIERRPESQALLFSGSLSFGPNYQAVAYFLKDIYPLVKQDFPAVKMMITGRAGGVELPPGLMDDGVHMLGYVDDIRQTIANASVSIAPILDGAGTRLKILEAMALGTPVVATSKGAEGLDVRHAEHLLIADTPGEFAGCVKRLLSDPEIGRQLGANARRLVSEKYNWERVLPQFLGMLEAVQSEAVR